MRAAQETQETDGRGRSGIARRGFVAGALALGATATAAALGRPALAAQQPTASGWPRYSLKVGGDDLGRVTYEADASLEEFLAGDLDLEVPISVPYLASEILSWHHALMSSRAGGEQTVVLTRTSSEGGPSLRVGFTGAWVKTLMLNGNKGEPMVTRIWIAAADIKRLA